MKFFDKVIKVSAMHLRSGPDSDKTLCGRDVKKVTATMVSDDSIPITNAMNTCKTCWKVKTR